jgi:hypothetical protein
MILASKIRALFPRGPVYDIRAYGAKCDGSTDDTTSINNAISAASKTGGTVLSPTGICITQPLTIVGDGDVGVQRTGGTLTLDGASPYGTQ